jgi:hypothetical protein
MANSLFYDGNEALRPLAIARYDKPNVHRKTMKFVVVVLFTKSSRKDAKETKQIRIQLFATLGLCVIDSLSFSSTA